MADVISVSELNHYVKTLLDVNDSLFDLALRGEIANFVQNARSGHCYFSLAGRSLQRKSSDVSHRCPPYGVSPGGRNAGGGALPCYPLRAGLIQCVDGGSDLPGGFKALHRYRAQQQRGADGQRRLITLRISCSAAPVFTGDDTNTFGVRRQRLFKCGLNRPSFPTEPSAVPAQAVPRPDRPGTFRHIRPRNAPSARRG